MSRKLLLLLSAGLALAAAPALAAEQVQQQLAGPGGGTIVRGGAPLPEFHLDFIIDEPSRPVLRGPGGSDNLEIALTSPENGVFRFFFSPRPQFGITFDRSTGTNRGYAGLTWNVFDSSTVFGNFGLAGSFDPGSGTPLDPTRRFAGQPLQLHGALELGYHLGDQHSLSLRVDESRTPELRAGESDNLRLKYGLKF